MQLKHVLIMILVWSVPAALIVSVLQRIIGIDPNVSPLALYALLFVSLAAMSPLSVHVAWWICKGFGFPPPLALASPCPHCGRKPRAWGCARQSWRVKIVLVCWECGESVELWLSRKLPKDMAVAEIPRFRLRWPEFLGVWRRVE